jgi:replicative DNA helicase
VAILPADGFILEKHGRIFKRMQDLHERSERIDRVTVLNELNKHGEAES